MNTEREISNLMRTLQYVIPKEYSQKKLYSFLKGDIKLSSKLIRTLKRTENGLCLNGEHIRTVDIVNEGDILTVNIPEDTSTVSACDFMPEVIYEDDDVIVVNKPAMLPIHESHNHQGDTLQNCLAGYFLKKGKAYTFRAVGRLDKGTSGLVLCALNSHTASRLSGNFEKEYLAIATGKYENSGVIDAPIYRPDPIKTYRTVDERGDRAVTNWTAVKGNEELTLLRIRLETGRTHQIRVHFAHLGTPLLSDSMYGELLPEIGHQCLHCEKLSFVHPISGNKIELSAAMPEEMQRVVDSL